MRLLHTMLRVGNLQRSIDFYTQVLGMSLNRTSENPSQKYSLAFVGYGTNPDHAEIELTYNWGTEAYDMAALLATLRWVCRMCTRRARESRRLEAM